MNKLENITTQYRTFSKGQYIEHTQFNEFLNYFDDQDRLSRVALQGVGIVCGLEHTLIYAPQTAAEKRQKIAKRLSSIQISQGVGVTTDGDLVTLHNVSEQSNALGMGDLSTQDFDSKLFTHVRAYNNQNVKYSPFYNGDAQIALWELATASEAGVNKGFVPLNDLTQLNDKYLLLYVESYEKEVRPCQGVDCDNHGLQQISNIKVVLTDKAGIENLAQKDELYLGFNINDRSFTPTKLERKIVNQHNVDTGLREIYSNNIDVTDTIKLIDIIADVNKILEKLEEPLIPLNPLVLEEVLQVISNKFADWSHGFQYLYDHIKDLYETHHEILKLLPKSFMLKLLNIESFAKHIMLGKLVKNEEEQFRHLFYKSPILDDENLKSQIRLLANRFRFLTDRFNKTKILDTDSEIEITPSQKHNPLGHKAIPFYYNTDDEFLKYWDFSKTKNRAYKQNLSYDITILDTDTHIQTPLNYTLDKHTFFRIEGHQGIAYDTAKESITTTRDQKGLAFDVMAVSIEELNNNEDLSKAWFTEYVEKHPGLEHKGGVQPGGTFILVYESEGNKTVIADFALPYLCCTPKEDPSVVTSIEFPDGNCCEDNQAPNANAGEDRTIQLPTNSVTLDGSLSSDSDGPLSYQWSKVSGGLASISSPTAVSTLVTGLSVGDYVFKLKVTDDQGLTATDTVEITVINGDPKDFNSNDFDATDFDASNF